MSYTAARLGQDNSANSATALFLTVFAGEVKLTFDQVNIMTPLHMVRDIQNGKSCTFPKVGQATTAFHQVGGADIDGTDISHSEVVVNIDDKLTASLYVAEIDELMSHYDLRAPFATELGRAMARAFDRRALQATVLAARASTIVTGGNGGSSVTHTGAATDAEVLKNAIISAAQKLDEKNIPETDRYAALRPAQYALLIQDTDVINADWAAGNGNLATGVVKQLNGITLRKSNNIPSTNIASATTGENNTYYGNFTNTVAPVWHRDAIGTARLLGLTVETAWKIEKQAWLTVAKYALGTKYINPECAYEIKNA